MSEETGSKSGHRAAIAIVAMMPVLYVLSIGPVAALAERGVIPPLVAINFYQPVFWLCQYRAFEMPLERYLELWGVFPGCGVW